MHSRFAEHLEKNLRQVKDSGFYKAERIIVSPQRTGITVEGRGKVINLCANNYLGLADSEELTAAAAKALHEYKAGMASVRFICGTLDIHKKLEEKVARFSGKEDAILYSSCFDANTGLFETILDAEDAIISDELNHASIIDGVRLCKAKRLRYRNNDMADLERCLKESQGQRFRLIATDGVFSMDGYLANLPDICALAQKYDALVMVDESHAAGFMGPHGGGTADHFGLRDEVDILTGTFGKALGGSSGGYTAASRPIVEWLRQRSRPYLFSNTLAPVITATALAALEIVEKNGRALQEKLTKNRLYFREKMAGKGFDLLPGEHAIVPVMLYDGSLAGKFAEEMLAEGVYVVGFSYPVVPEGRARIRTQISAAHTREQLDRAIAAFEKAGRKLEVI